MLKIDEQGLESSAAPSVYVRSIKVNESSIGQSVKDNSTDNSRKPRAIPNQIDGTLNYLQPPQKMEDNSDEFGLQVEMELSVVALDDLNSKGLNWIDNERARSPLIVKIIQSSNKDLSDELGSSDFFDTNDASVFQNYNQYVDYEIRQVSLSSRDNNKSTIVQQKNDLTRNKILNLVERVSFDITKKPDHLTYFVLCQVGEMPNNSPLIAHSPVVVEKVIESSEVVERAFRFINPEDNSIWPGAVHYHPTSGWMQGAFHTNSAHKSLVKQEVQNTKISYTPNVEKVINAQINISNRVNETPKNYFSNLYITRSKDGSAVFGFNFDHLNFMINNSEFGGLFLNSSPRVVETLLSASPIIDLSVKRERVRIFQADNRLESTADLIADYDIQQDPETVISSYDISGVLKSNIKYAFDGELSYLNTRQVYEGDEIPSGFSISATVKEVSLNNLNSYRMFTGQDMQVSKFTDGVYQYSVSLQIKDGTKQFLETKLQELRLSIMDSEAYLSRASASRNYNVQTNKFTDSFIAAEFSTALNESWFEAIVKYIEILDILTNINEKDKTSLAKALYSFVNPAVANIDSIVRFINLLNSLESKLEKIIMKDHTRHTREKSAIAGGGSYPVLDASSNFMDVFDTNVIKNSGFDYIGVEGSSGIVSVTRNQFSSRLAKEYDRISDDLFTADEAQQQFKFLDRGNISSLFADNSKGSDMAPAFIDLDGKRVDLLSQNIDSLDYVSVTAVAQNILLDNAAGSHFIGASSDTDVVLNQAGKGSQEERIKNIKELQQKTSKIIGLSTKNMGTQPSVTNSNVSSVKYLGQSNKFTSAPPEQEALTIRLEKDEPEDATSLVGRVLQILNVSPDLSKASNKSSKDTISFDLSKENNFISKNVIPSKQTGELDSTQKGVNDFLKDLPHQQKLLTLRKTRLYNDTAAKAASNDDADTDGFVYNFGLLRRVEYLSGFSGGSIKAEMWKKLTLEELSLISGTVFCRIRKQNQTNLNIGDYNLFDQLPIYNEYFFITADEGGNEQEDEFEQQEIVNLLLTLLASSTNMSDDIQYLATQVSKPPTSSFKKITGLKAARQTRQAVRASSSQVVSRGIQTGSPRGRSSGGSY